MCPACKEPLVVFELDGVEIDRCLKCKGTWLDSGEIEHLARLEGEASDRMTAELARAEEGPKGERRCVRCRARMSVVSIHEVEIDRCPQGHGIWFDRDEMETLLASFRGRPGDAMARLLGELHPPKGQNGG